MKLYKNSSKDLLHKKIDLIGVKYYGRNNNKKYGRKYSTIQSEETCFSLTSIKKYNETIQIKKINKPKNFSDDDSSINNNIDSFLKQKVKSHSKKKIILKSLKAKNSFKNFNEKSPLIKVKKDNSVNNIQTIKNENKKKIFEFFTITPNNTKYKGRNFKKKEENTINKNLTESRINIEKNKNLFNKKLKIKKIKDNFFNENKILIKKKEKKHSNRKIFFESKIDTFNSRLCFPYIIKDNKIMFEIYNRNLDFQKNRLRDYYKENIN